MIKSKRYIIDPTKIKYQNRHIRRLVSKLYEKKIENCNKNGHPFPYNILERNTFFSEKIKCQNCYQHLNYSSNYGKSLLKSRKNIPDNFQPYDAPLVYDEDRKNIEFKIYRDKYLAKNILYKRIEIEIKIRNIKRRIKKDISNLF